MLPIATDGVAWSVGVSVCCWRSRALQKRLNRLRCCLGALLDWTQGTTRVLDGGPVPSKGKRNLGLSSLLKKHSHYCGVCSKKSITASPWLLQPTAFLPTGQCHFIFPREKMLPPAMRPLLKILTAYLNFGLSFGKYDFQCCFE